MLLVALILDHIIVAVAVAMHGVVQTEFFRPNAEGPKTSTSEDMYETGSQNLV